MSIISVWICSKCGHVNNDDDYLCKKCGEFKGN